MKNNIYKIFIIIFFCLSFSAYSEEEFNFDVTEILILENGNKFKGLKKGTATSNDGIIINADEFEYDKSSNILNAIGNVKVEDTINNIKIFSNMIIYKKNDEIIFSKGNSKAINYENKTEIEAEIFNYDITKNIIEAKNNVIVKNKIDNYVIISDFATYLRNEEKIFTEGKTSGILNSKYNFESEDMVFSKRSMTLNSNKSTTITDNFNLYNLKKFVYFIDREELRGEKILVKSNYNLPDSDNFYFSSAIINLNTQDFEAKDTKIKMHKGIFNNPENDPRLYGVSSRKRGNTTIINKGIFTSCKERDNCPPWSIQAGKISHNKDKKLLIYDNAILKIYDVPVLYFPKFFHPDPSVRRQSGFLKPQINSSDELGDSIHTPYFHVISDSKDITFKPTLFNNSIKMLQNEYRQKNKNSSFITDFSFTTGYKSPLFDKKKNISHLFSKFNSDLGLKNFEESDLSISIEKVTNDTYLKVFDTNLPETELKPSSQSNLTSEVKLNLNNKKYNLTTGMKAFENLNQHNNDRYQYILPYYDFEKYFGSQFLGGDINFSSSGSNDLNNTNNLKSKVINNFDYSSNSRISKFGILNNLNIYFKNLNTIGKNDNVYKSSPQIELMNIYEISSELPLKKTKGKYDNFLTPKISFRFNPSDMKNHSSALRNVTADGIFGINRLGLDDSFEKGKSLTVGLNYKKERLKNINEFFEFKLATVLRDREEDFIPSSSSLNKKNSNLFGSIETKLSKNFNLDYNFRIDNNYDKFEYNSINANFLFDNFETSFNFVEENGETGDENFLENKTTYKIDDNNFFSFNTRRNRKLNLTEFYDLLYEYKNDCLIASIKYKKKYYSDRDLKPSENLLLSVTLYPFTTYEHNETALFK